MNKVQFIFLLIISFNFNLAFCQTNERLEDEIHIYWQPNIKLNTNDFEFDGTKEKNAELYCEKVKLCMCASTNINIIIDSPINKKKHNKQLEKIYIVPVFDKIKSYALTKDTLGLNQQKIVFDIEEWAARYARKQFKITREQFKDKQGLLTTWHKVIFNETQNKKEKLNYEFTLDIYLEPKANAYNDWRTKVDKMLDDLKEYATTKEECDRFIRKKVIEEGYEETIFLGCENHK
jgi:hypothetical protein